MGRRIRNGLCLTALLHASLLGAVRCGRDAGAGDGGIDVGPIPPGHVAFVLSFRAGPYCREFVHRIFERIYVQYVESPWRGPTGEVSRGPWPLWVRFDVAPLGALEPISPQRFASCDCSSCPQPECDEILHDFADRRFVAWPVEDGKAAVALWDGLVTGGDVPSCDGPGCIGRAQAPPGRYAVWLSMGYSYETRPPDEWPYGD
jgi:hypothetical protein